VSPAQLAQALPANDSLARHLLAHARLGAWKLAPAQPAKVLTAQLAQALPAKDSLAQQLLAQARLGPAWMLAPAHQAEVLPAQLAQALLAKLLPPQLAQALPAEDLLAQQLLAQVRLVLAHALATAQPAKPAATIRAVCLKGRSMAVCLVATCPVYPTPRHQTLWVC
jgi:hypothetical protein